MSEAQQLLEMAAGADLARLRDGDALSIPGLRALPPLKRVSTIRLWLNQAGHEAPSTARLTEALRQVFDAEADHQPAIVFGPKALRRYRQRLFVTPADPPRVQETQSWIAAEGSSVELGPGLGNLTWVPQRGGLAAERLPAAVTVRRRDGGETLKPAVSAKTQTVQHLCQTLGVLPWMRDALPLVFAGDELIAVADLWLDARWCLPKDAPGLKDRVEPRPPDHVIGLSSPRRSANLNSRRIPIVPFGFRLTYPLKMAGANVKSAVTHYESICFCHRRRGFLAR